MKLTVWVRVILVWGMAVSLSILAVLVYLDWQEAKAFREKLLMEAVEKELIDDYARRHSPTPAGIQSPARSPWRVATPEEGAWLDGQPPIWDGDDRMNARVGQTWQWVTNDHGEWMYKQVQDSGIRIRFEKSVLKEKP